MERVDLALLIATPVHRAEAASGLGRLAWARRGVRIGSAQTMMSMQRLKWPNHGEHIVTRLLMHKAFGLRRLLVHLKSPRPTLSDLDSSYYPINATLILFDPPLSSESENRESTWPLPHHCV